MFDESLNKSHTLLILINVFRGLDKSLTSILTKNIVFLGSTTSL
jgi:hypothetical protein